MSLSAEERRVHVTLARLSRQLHQLDPETRQREVVRIRLQILWNSIRLAPGLTASARAVLREPIDARATGCGVCVRRPLRDDDETGGA